MSGEIQPLRWCSAKHWVPVWDFRHGRKTCTRCLARRVVISRRWTAANPERHRNNSRRCQARNPDCHRERVRRWMAANPERVRETHRRSVRLRRARKRNATIGDIPRDAEHQLLWFQGGRCAYCHAVLIDYHVDHVIPLARGGSHSWENLVLACPSCNSRKGKRLVEEWRVEEEMNQ